MLGEYVLPKQVDKVRFSYRPEERPIRWRGLGVFFFMGSSRCPFFSGGFIAPGVTGGFIRNANTYQE